MFSWRKPIRVICLSLALFQASQAVARAEEAETDRDASEVRVVLQRKSQPETLPGLSFEESTYEIKHGIPPAGIVGSGAVTYVSQVRGSYRDEGFSLLYSGKEVKRASNGKFVIQVPITAEAGSFRLSIVDPKGAVRTEVIGYRVPGFLRLQQMGRMRPISHHRFSMGFGASSLGYTDDRIEAPIYETLLTLQGGYQYLLGKNGSWKLSAGAEAGTFKFQGSDAARSIRTLGANALVSRNLFGPYSGGLTNSLVYGWDFSLGLGAFYQTSFVQGGTFGFKNATGPVLMSSASYRFGSRNELSGRFSYSPISDGATKLLPGSRELRAGLLYQLAPPSLGVGIGQSPGYWSFCADYSLARLLIGDSQVESVSYSLGANYHFMY